MKSIKYIYVITTMVMMPQLLLAKGGESHPAFQWVYDNILFVIVALVLAIVFYFLWQTMESMVEVQKNKYLAQHGITPKPKVIDEKSWFSRMYDKALNMVPVSNESDIELDHDYDGIRELDNSLPPWWLYMFYFTIALGIGYLYVYHFSDLGASQSEEYYATMEVADKKRRAFLYEQANKVNENNVVALSDAAQLAEGEKIWVNLCVSCHGKLGEGMAGLGPNMTDKYWIHGGDIGSIFSTIKYGVQEKGMISWQDQLPPQSMQQVASFILTLQGTNPPNAKAPQGTLYEPEQ